MGKNICFILDYYPTKLNNGCVFVKHLIYAIADQGHECSVICPQIMIPANYRKENRMPYFREEYTPHGSKISIYAPHYIHVGSSAKMIKRSMDHHYKSALKVIRKHNLKPDYVYGHFIYQCGITAARLGQTLGIPSYCACGENSLRLMEGSQPYDNGLKYGEWREYLKNLSGIISVSSYNKQLLRENEFIDESIPVGVYPNSIDKDKFYKMDRSDARRELGLAQDKFIIAFVGQFKESKGIVELSQALKQCDDVYSMFMGKGPLSPDCDRVLHCGVVNNNDLYKYLNAADVFVLPTKGEGCSNAIIEALACGLPVISADLPFNHDVLDESNSILVDVDNDKEIADAICLLRDDEELRHRLALGASRTANKLDIHARAKNILQFMGLDSVKQTPTKILNVMPDLKKGGVQSEVMNPTRLLNGEEAHFDVMLLSDTKGYYEAEFKKYGHIYRLPLKKRKTKVGRALFVFLNFIITYNTMTKFFRDHRDYNAVHTRDPFLNAPALMAAYKAEIPVRIAHCAVNKPGKEFPNRLYVRFYLWICSKIICRYSTHRFGVTESAVEYMFGKGKGIVTKNPTIDLKKFNPALYPQEYDDTIRLLMVGSYGSRKNQKFAIKVLKELQLLGRKSELVFVGYPRSDKDPYLPEMKADVKKLELTESVTFLPQYADIPYEMSRATFLLIPSLQEGLPNVALEAQAMGLPCIISRYVSDECNYGLCTYIDLDKGPEYWAEKLIEIVDKNGFERRYVDMSMWDNYKISLEYLEYWRGKPMKID